MGTFTPAIAQTMKCSIMDCLSIFTARKRSLRRLCFYTCVSVHRGDGLVPGDGCGAWSRGGVPGPGRVCGDAPVTATAAGGTHPTGMHSCRDCVDWKVHTTVHAYFRCEWTSMSVHFAQHWDVQLRKVDSRWRTQANLRMLTNPNKWWKYTWFDFGFHWRNQRWAPRKFPPTPVQSKFTFMQFSNKKIAKIMGWRPHLWEWRTILKAVWVPLTKMNVCPLCPVLRLWCPVENSSSMYWNKTSRFVYWSVQANDNW